MNSASRNVSRLRARAGLRIPALSRLRSIDYRDRGVEIADDEIFLSDGSKCDCGHILDILGDQNKIAITDPVYPVYVDTNVMAGHTGAGEEGWRLRRDGLSAVHGGEQFRAAASA